MIIIKNILSEIKLKQLKDSRLDLKRYLIYEYLNDEEREVILNKLQKTEMKMEELK